MNHPSNRPMGRAIGLRDAKQLAKALAAELASQRPSTVAQCRELIERLPLPRPHDGQIPKLPPFSATPSDASSQTQPSSTAAFGGLLTHTTGDPQAALLLGTVDEPQNLLQKVFRRKPQEVAWTQEGALGHGLLFGCCCSGQTETVATLVREAMKTGMGATLINANGDHSLVRKMLAHAKNVGGEHVQRVRLLNFMTADDPHRPGHTHTFNPFAEAHAAEMTQVLMSAIDHPGIMDGLSEPQQELVLPLIIGVMFYLAWGRDQGLWPLDLARIAQGLRFHALVAAAADGRPHPQIRTALDSFFHKLQQVSPQAPLVELYAPFEEVLVERLLAPAAKHFAQVLGAKTNGDQWFLPDVSAPAMLNERLVTVVSLWSLEKSPEWVQLPGRLLAASLAHEVVAQSLASKAQPSEQAALKHLVVAQQANYYLSGRSAQQLLGFGRRAGVSCLISAADYPALKTEPGLAEAIDKCNTKFFMRQCDPEAEDYARALGASPERPASPFRLKELRQGEAHILAGQKLVQARLHYVSPSGERATPPSLRARRFVSQRVRRTEEIVEAGRQRMAHELLQRLEAAGDSKLALAWCQETVARMLGYAHWHELARQKR